MDTTTHIEHTGLSSGTGRERRRMLMWIMLCALAALLVYVGFRAYLNPELLFHFANSLYC